MPVRAEIHEGVVPVKVYTGEIEPAARQQLVNISRLPIVHHHVAAMPDVHLGIGATVGSVIPTKQAIIPAAVGVDIGCGMIARRLSLSANELDEPALRKVFNQISRDVPVGFAQDYARANRAEMMELVIDALHRHLPSFEATEEAVNCHHNYVERETHYGEPVWLTRKGAIRAGRGELGIIPGSMGARSYIVRGKGAAESFQSCAHGAGRRMSRKAAQKRYGISDLIEQTQGVVCRKDKGVLDEIPGAYKDSDEVMANQADLVEPLHTLKQVLCVKG